ncbi:hypothetical protein GCM10023115_35380 [Pontixanthobacter gangjinensis]|uniref:Uncharacterized protein n=1 Tax=Christiangramia aestuarii TaxID=1028746 RepID=A0A7K1LR86_9FLAO|nr:hypothetical protein [Christiangramia aestuarii]MUP43293.1 hypothetical protein [Christiangramia aestuarii]
MDINSLSIGLLLFAVFMFPIAYILFNQKAKENKIKKDLVQIASKNHLKLDKMESFGHLSLGFDSIHKKLIILEFGDLDKAQVLDLKEVSQVRIARTLETGFSGNIKKDRMVHIALELAGKKQDKLAEICFYDEDDYDSTDADIRLNEAKKWDELLQKNLAV